MPLFKDIRARFHHERGMEYFLFVLLIFFTSFSTRLDFNRGKINKKRKECSILRS